MGKPAITTANIRELITPMQFRYHRYAHACDAVDQEIRAILAGERTGTVRLRRLMADREEEYLRLQDYLQHTCARIKSGDIALKAKLGDKAAKVRAAGSKRSIAFDNE